jgi:hypothetical protein
LAHLQNADPSKLLKNWRASFRKPYPDRRFRAVRAQAPRLSGIHNPGRIDAQRQGVPAPVMSLRISDGEDRRDAVLWFIDAFGYWKHLLSEEKLIAANALLPNKIIRPQALKAG